MCVVAAADEDYEPLFFEFQVTADIWKQICSQLHIAVDNKWDDIISCFAAFVGPFFAELVNDTVQGIKLELHIRSQGCKKKAIMEFFEQNL